MNGTDEELLDAAAKALGKAWAPYSGFSVGAALLTEGGKVFTGANVENASYGLTICAERVAVFKAVTEGNRSFTKLALVCDGDNPVPPCGACLQVLKEFVDDLPMVLANIYGKSRRARLNDLLPSPFVPKDLGSAPRGSSPGS